MVKNIETLRSYEPNDVMKYLNEVMSRIADIESDNSLKDKQLYNYDIEVRRLQQENLNLKNQINYYKQIENTLNSSMAMVRNTGENIRNNALKEREVIIADAKNNASRILNDALIRASNINMEADSLKKSIAVYKSKIKALVESELEVISDIDKVDF